MKRIFQRIESALLRHGTQPQTIFFIAVLSVLDSFLPVLPAELFVIALCILQPRQGKTIVLLFAASAAFSAFLLALALSTLSSSADAWSQQLLGTQGPETMAIVRDWGPVSMVFFFYISRHASCLYRAAIPERRDTFLDRWHGVHWKADALRRAVVFDTPLAIEGRTLARCRVFLAKIFAAPCKSLRGLLPQNSMACAKRQISQIGRNFRVAYQV